MQAAVREMCGMLRHLSLLLRSIDPSGMPHRTLAQLSRQRRSAQPGTDHRRLGQWSPPHHNAQLDTPHRIAHQTSPRHRNAQQDTSHCKRHCQMHLGRTDQQGIGYRLRPSLPKKTDPPGKKRKTRIFGASVCQVGSQVIWRGKTLQVSVSMALVRLKHARDWALLAILHLRSL